LDLRGVINYIPSYPGALFGNMTVAYTTISPSRINSEMPCDLAVFSYSSYFGGYPYLLLSSYLSLPPSYYHHYYFQKKKKHQCYHDHSSSLSSLLHIYILYFLWQKIKYQIHPELGYVVHNIIQNNNPFNSSRSRPGTSNIRWYQFTNNDNNLTITSTQPPTSFLQWGKHYKTDSLTCDASVALSPRSGSSWTDGSGSHQVYPFFFFN
jgi:hypothetical protein